MYLKLLSRIAVVVFLSIALNSCWITDNGNEYDDNTPVDYSFGDYHPVKKIHEAVRYNNYPSDIATRQVWTWNGNNLQRISKYTYGSGNDNSLERTDYIFTYDSHGCISSVTENMYGTDNTVSGTRTHTYTYYPNKVMYSVNGREQFYYKFNVDGTVSLGQYYDASYYIFSPLYNPIKNLPPQFNFFDYMFYHPDCIALSFSDNMIAGLETISYYFNSTNDNYPTSISSSSRLLYQISYY